MAAATLGIRTVTVPAAAATLVAAGGSKMRALINIGTNPVTLGSSNAVTANNGIPLAAARSAGGQGGGFSFGDAPTLQTDLYAISTLGTTLAVMEG